MRIAVAVLATGVGNVRSVVRAIDRASSSVSVSKPGVTWSTETTRDPERVRQADVLVVPGQGSFGAFAEALSSGLAEAVRERVSAGAPYLGICLGLQILFDASDEAPGARGLSVFGGRVHRLAPGLEPGTERPWPLPHAGWNRVAAPNDAGGRVPASHYYFAHSYAAVPDDASLTLATTEYGVPFPSAVGRDNVLGVQFHPEKSQRAGLELLTRFFTSVALRGGAPR
jgi:glutamine amidotransferase